MMTNQRTIYHFNQRAMAKTGAIEQTNDVHNGVITYRMKDKRKNLPKYKEVKIDGLHVSLILEDDFVFPLPACFRGYELHSAMPHEIILKKRTA